MNYAKTSHWPGLVKWTNGYKLLFTIYDVCLRHLPKMCNYLKKKINAIYFGRGLGYTQQHLILY